MKFENIMNEQHYVDWHHPASQPIMPSEKTSPCLSNEQTQEEVDVMVTEPQLAKPPMYAVVMYNDDFTPMDFVVYVLQSQFHHNIDDAVKIMLNIHNQGRGIAGIYPKDIAETKAQTVNQTARKEGYPLLCQIEPYKD